MREFLVPTTNLDRFSRALSQNAVVRNLVIDLVAQKPQIIEPFLPEAPTHSRCNPTGADFTAHETEADPLENPPQRVITSHSLIEVDREAEQFLLRLQLTHHRAGLRLASDVKRVRPTGYAS